MKAGILPQDRTDARLIGIAMAVCYLTLSWARTYCFSTANDAMLISIIPDDAFYYLQLARNHSHGMGWTFDGTAPTSGFHPLYGYLLSAIYKIFNPDWRTIFIMISLTASTACAWAVYETTKLVCHLSDNTSGLTAGAILISPICIEQSNLLMESWLVMPIGALLVKTALKPNIIARQSNLLYGFTLGFLGSISRSDFGLLPFMLLVGTTIQENGVRNPRSQTAIYATLGATLGAIAVSLHTYSISGSLIQASAATKLIWSQTFGFNFSSSWRFFANCLSIPLKPARFLGVFALAAMATSIISRPQTNKNQQKPIVTASLLTGALTISGYLVVYRQNSEALHDWYATSYAIPLALTFGSISAKIPSKQVKSIAAICLLLYFLLGSAANTTKSKWPHQASLMTAGLELPTDNTPYGAWNSGILGFFHPNHVINLDGLVNDEILEHIKNRSLPSYIRQRNIEYIIDFDVMIHEDRWMRRGGYSSEWANKCLKFEKYMDDEDSPTWINSRLTKFKVNEACLSNTREPHQ